MGKGINGFDIKSWMLKYFHDTFRTLHEKITILLSKLLLSKRLYIFDGISRKQFNSIKMKMKMKMKTVQGSVIKTKFVIPIK